MRKTLPIAFALLIAALVLTGHLRIDEYAITLVGPHRTWSCEWCSGFSIETDGSLKTFYHCPKFYTAPSR
ncbi:MAG TPA: hypothetical protein VN578_02500 [Candidatus Binatia bacterium]|jgi:hypothetical protein|nr:hypothetical protein [Candidatus Binatia bacterium]